METAVNCIHTYFFVVLHKMQVDACFSSESRSNDLFPAGTVCLSHTLHTLRACTPTPPQNNTDARQIILAYRQ